MTMAQLAEEEGLSLGEYHRGVLRAFGLSSALSFCVSGPAVSALVALTPMSSGRAKKAWVVITSIIFDLAYL